MLYILCPVLRRRMRIAQILLLTLASPICGWLWFSRNTAAVTAESSAPPAPPAAPSPSVFSALAAAREIFAAIATLPDSRLRNHRRDVLDSVLERIFAALKRSGLATSIVRMSLEDDDVRAGLTDITVDLLEAGVIPYYDIFAALKESGLAVEVAGATLTDPDTREGALALAREVGRQMAKPTL